MWTLPLFKSYWWLVLSYSNIFNCSPNIFSTQNYFSVFDILSNIFRIETKKQNFRRSSLCHCQRTTWRDDPSLQSSVEARLSWTEAVHPAAASSPAVKWYLSRNPAPQLCNKTLLFRLAEILLLLLVVRDPAELESALYKYQINLFL